MNDDFLLHSMALNSTKSSATSTYPAAFQRHSSVFFNFFPFFFMKSQAGDEGQATTGSQT
jgi:hypothetical protein